MDGVVDYRTRDLRVLLHVLLPSNNTAFGIKVGGSVLLELQADDVGRAFALAVMYVFFPGT